MDTAITLMGSTLSIAVKASVMAGAKAGVSRANSIIARTNASGLLEEMTQEELEAKIDNVFGNKFSQQLLDIQKYLDSCLLSVNKEVRDHVLKQAVFSEYRMYQQRIEETLFHLTPWLRHPNNVDARDDFLQAYKRNDPTAILHSLHKRFTTDVFGTKLIDDIVELCGKNWDQYNEWKKHICLTLSQACSIYTAYLCYKLNLSNRDLPQASDEVSLPLETMERLQDLRLYVDELLSVLEDGLSRVKAHFLFTKCGDKKHRYCGAVGDEDCNTLVAKVYKYLGDTEKEELESENLANPLAKSLREAYPQFQWSVVVVENGNDEFFYNHVDEEKKSCMWLQTVGTVTTGLLGQVKKYGKIESKGLQFGRLLCFRLRSSNLLKRRVLVFWTETKNIVAGKFDSSIAPWKVCAGSDMFPLPLTSLSAGLTAEQKEMVKEREGILITASEPFTEFSFSKLAEIYRRKELLFVVDDWSGQTWCQRDLANVGYVTFPLCFLAGKDDPGRKFALFWPIDGTAKRDEFYFPVPAS